MGYCKVLKRISYIKVSNANINRTGSSSSALQKIGFIVAVICFYGPHLIRGASGDFDEDNNIINCWTLTGQISLPITSLELLYEADGNQDAQCSDW